MILRGTVTETKYVDVDVKGKEVIHYLKTIFDKNFDFMSLRAGDFIHNWDIHKFDDHDYHKNEDCYKKDRSATPEEQKIYDAFKLVFDCINKVEQNGM